MVLQVALKDIGQLTDFETTAQRASSLTVHRQPNGTGFPDRPADYQILVISQKVVPVPAP